MHRKISGCLCIAAWSQELPCNYLARTNITYIFVRPLFPRLICSSYCPCCVWLAHMPVFVSLQNLRHCNRIGRQSRQPSIMVKVNTNVFSMRRRHRRLEAHESGQASFDISRTPFQQTHLLVSQESPNKLEVDTFSFCLNFNLLICW